MGRLLYLLRLYRRLIGLRIQAQLVDRSAFVLDVLTTAVSSGLGFLTIALVIQRFDRIGGWQLGEVAFLFGMVEFAFGTMDMVFSGFDPAVFGNQVRLGAFDQLLLRPVNIILQVFSSDFQIRRLGRLSQGLFIFLFSLTLIDIHWTVVKLLYLPVIFASMVAFFGGLFVVGAAITFWTVESVEFINIFTYGGAEMMSYPMHIYPHWMRTFFTFILPAIFLIYFPAVYILDKPNPLGYASLAYFLSPLAGFATLFAGFALFNFGMRHYQSTGT